MERGAGSARRIEGLGASGRFRSIAKSRASSRIPPRAKRYADAPKPSPGAQAAYLLALRGFLAEYERLVTSAIKADSRFRLDDKRGLLDRLAGIAKRLPLQSGIFSRFLQVTNTQARATDKQLQALGINHRSDKATAKLMDQWRTEQLAKITSLAKYEVGKLGELLGDRETIEPKALRNLIQERFRVTRSKADLLARDQTLTLSARLSQHKMQAAGVTEYIWTTAQDERVREYHKDLEGQRFRFDDPPIISEDGRRGNPGDDFQCRCVASPILPEFD